MADISDVEQAVANTITSVLYPSGPSQPSIVSLLCRVYRGWPNPATLNADLKAGIVNITVTTDNDSGRPTTRYLPAWRTKTSQPGLTAHAVDRTITISGNPAEGDVIGALINGSAYAYRIQAGDSPNLVAANLSQLIQSNYIAHVLGSTLAIPGARHVTVRVVCDGTASFESRRQEKDLRIICWCPSPSMRDLAASSIDAALDRLDFLALEDDSDVRIAYRNTAGYDQAQNALLYRRDLIYTIEYPTIAVHRLPSMLFGASEVDGNITYG